MHQTNAIARNSLAEALGRSQVSFQGITNISDDRFLYEQKDLLGRKSEDIIYRADNGDLRYREYRPDEQIKKEIAYNHKKNELVIVTIENDYKTEVRQVGGMTYTKTFDPKLRPILQKVEDQNGNSDAIERDFERGRVIKRFKRAGQERDVVEVYSLKTKERVTSGPLVEDRIEGKDGIFRTINIITGALYRLEKYNGRDYHIVDFSKTTGLKTKETKTYKGRKYVTLYNEQGIRTKVITLDKNGDKTYDIYAPDGTSVISSYKNSYDSDGKVIQYTVYIPGTGTIKELTDYNYSDDTCVKYYYNKTPNYALRSEFYRNGKLESQSEYYATGKDNRLLKKKTTFINERETLEEEYSNNGKRRKVLEVHKRDNKAYCIEKYDEDTGVMYEKLEVHPGFDNCFTIERYDNFEGTLMKKQIYRDRILMVNQFFD